MFSIFKKIKLEIVDKSQLTDGTEIVSDTIGFEIGAEVFVIASDGTSIALPDGQYQLEDGVTLQVVAGKVSDKILAETAPEDEVAPVEEEVESELKIEDEVSTEEEVIEEAPVEEVEEVKEEVDYAKLIEDLTSRLVALEEAISKMGLKADELEVENTKLSQVVLELSDEPAVSSLKVNTNTKTEISDIDARVQVIKNLRNSK